MNVTIGKKIKSMRQSKNISQIDLSKNAGIAQSTLSYLENGKKTPQFETLWAICKALDVTILELLTYDEPDIKFKLLEQYKPYENIPAAGQCKYDAVPLSVKSKVPASIAREIDAFERYLYMKYHQKNNI